MRILEKINEDIWKIKGWSNFYFLNFDKKILIDTGLRNERRLFENVLSKLIPFERVDLIIFTHFHLDHIGNFGLFPNANLFKSKKHHLRDDCGFSAKALPADHS